MENNWETDQNILIELVNRFENQLMNNESIYFDIEDFDDIANYYMDEANYELASVSIEKAMLCYPESEQVILLKVDLLFCQGEYKEAIKFIDETSFIELLSVATFMKAKSYLYLKKYKEASYEIEKTVSINPEEKETILIDISDIFLELNENERAINIIFSNFKKDEISVNILQQIAYCYEVSNNPDKAIEYYNKCLDETPFDKDLWISLGMLQGRLEKYEDALVSFDFALAIDDEMEIAINAKANTLISLGRCDEALETVENIEDEFVTNFIQCKVAEIYSDEKEYDKAIVCYRKLIASDPNFTIAYLGLAVILSKQDDYENALTYIDKAIELNPDNADYYFVKGEMLLNMGSFAEATLNFKQVLALFPNDVNSWLAISFIDDAEVANGIDSLEKYLTDCEEENLNDYLYALSVLYFRGGNIDKCLSYLNRYKEEKELIESFFKTCPLATENVDINKFLEQNITE